MSLLVLFNDYNSDVAGNAKVGCVPSFPVHMVHSDIEEDPDAQIRHTLERFKETKCRIVEELASLAVGVTQERPGWRSKACLNTGDFTCPA